MNHLYRLRVVKINDEGGMEHDIYFNNVSVCCRIINCHRKNDKCDDRSAKEFFANALLNVP